jgi:hypothetical protein
MNTEQQAKFQEYVRGIAEILYAEANPEEMKTFEGIETNLRNLIQKHVAPELAVFLLKQQQVQQQEKPGK